MRYQVAAAALMLLQLPSAAASFDYAGESAYLDKFLPFIEWPQSSFLSADSPIDVCIVGRNPFGRLMDQAVAGQRIGGRAIVIRYLPNISANSACHLAYIAGSADQTVSQAIGILRNRPILTVTDVSADAADRGMVNLVVGDSKVRFEIDEQAAEQSHLSISSKLLDLAIQRQKEK